jgi:hypothetical protein
MPAIAAARGVLAAWRASGSTVLTVSPCRERRGGRYSAALSPTGYACDLANAPLAGRDRWASLLPISWLGVAPPSGGDRRGAGCSCRAASCHSVTRVGGACATRLSPGRAENQPYRLSLCVVSNEACWVQLLTRRAFPSCFRSRSAAPTRRGAIRNGFDQPSRWRGRRGARC